MTTTLTEEMDSFAQIFTSIAGREEAAAVLCMVEPSLNTESLDDTRDMICVLAGAGSGGELARQARMLVFAFAPRLAILGMEGWTIRPDVPKDHPVHKQVLAGETWPSQLPDELRGETLTLYGETADGEQQDRMWDILPQPDGTRRLEPHDVAGATMHSRFRPLFLVDEALRAIGGNSGLDPEVERRAARNAVAMMFSEFPTFGQDTNEHRDSTREARSKMAADARTKMGG